jgi:hypothetical protein
VQVERRERIVEGMKFEDIVPGIQLRVSPNSIEKYAHIMHTLGRIGVVAGTRPFPSPRARQHGYPLPTCCGMHCFSLSLSLFSLLVLVLLTLSSCIYGRHRHRHAARAAAAFQPRDS